MSLFEASQQRSSLRIAELFLFCPRIAQLSGPKVMALYRDHVLPCLTHLTMSNRRLIEYWRRVVSQARGRVWKSGSGSASIPITGHSPAAEGPKSRSARSAISW